MAGRSKIEYAGAELSGSLSGIHAAWTLGSVYDLFKYWVSTVGKGLGVAMEMNESYVKEILSKATRVPLDLSILEYEQISPTDPADLWREKIEPQFIITKNAQNHGATVPLLVAQRCGMSRK
ncbi:hypothetical protein O9G_000333 [Rozella allomycis CSF55]|uniref:Uncharacterized protein n=1 Tax=Rozella allomycis (strain CSF55) TaxID=988480 RepID=A0A075ATI2_ROZAC|nr:hypothetical protein O9G_000333 [Rozella allomycis CSF55]|eukprot:EPZ33558.1 hypothetical protein O9G_000333 [Rozella allomycis CSF55]